MRMNSRYIDGIWAESSRIKLLLGYTREIIAASKELLTESAPSTFLGRKTFEPFPQEDE